MSRRRPSKAIPALTPGGPAPDLRSRAVELMAIVDEELKRLKTTDPRQQLVGMDRHRAIQRVAQLLDKVGKLTGETLEISDAQMVKAPAFRRIADRLVEALRPYPQAMRAAGDALMEMAEEQQR